MERPICGLDETNIQSCAIWLGQTWEMWCGVGKVNSLLPDFQCCPLTLYAHFPCFCVLKVALLMTWCFNGNVLPFCVPTIDR